MVEGSTKTCRDCKQEKTLEEFYRQKEGLFGRRSRCKGCESSRIKTDRKSNPEKFKSADSRYRDRNREKLREYTRKYYREDKVKHRARVLKYKYGMSLSDYELLFNAQGGVCAICKKLNLRSRESYLIVDHCHQTGKVRGLLCHRCNAALGLFKDNVVNLAGAVDYLNQKKPA